MSTYGLGRILVKDLVVHSLHVAFSTSLRRLTRKPLFAITASLVIATSIAATTSMFALVNQLILRPPDGVSQPKELFRLRVDAIASRLNSTARSSISYPDFQNLQRRLHPQIQLLASANRTAEVQIDNEISTRAVQLVSNGYFAALGASPFAGRHFQQDDGSEYSAQEVIVVSYASAEAALGGASVATGKKIRINGVVYHVIGVTQSHFAGLELSAPFGWVLLPRASDFGSSPEMLRRRQATWLTVFGRRTGGANLLQISAQLQSAHEQDVEGRGEDKHLGIPEVRYSAAKLADLGGSGITAPTAMAKWLLGLALILLLLAAINLSVLLAARFLARQAELTIRIAVGASMKHVIGDLFVECFLVVAAGIIGGLAISGMVRPALALITGATVHLTEWRVVAFLSLLVVVVIGIGMIVPVLVLTRQVGRATGVLGLMQQNSARFTPMRGALIVQLALAFILTATALGFIRSVRGALTLNLGISTQQLAVVSVPWTRDPWAAAFLELAKERLRSLPVVERVATSSATPLFGRGTRLLQPPGVTTGVEPIEVGSNIVEPGYFATAGISFVSGRDFSDADDGEGWLVVIVNETLAKNYWPDQTAVGKCLSVTRAAPTSCTLRVVGVVPDSKYGEITEPRQPHIYAPIRQMPAVPMILLVRTRGPADQSTFLLRSALNDLHAPSAVEIQPVSQLVRQQTARWTQAAWLVAVFSCLSLGLSMFGIYTAVSLTTLSTRRDHAIRLALGATGTQLIASTLYSRVADVLVASLLGTVVFSALARSLQYAIRLPQIDQVDSALASLGLLLATSMAASAAACRWLRVLQPNEAMK